MTVLVARESFIAGGNRPVSRGDLVESTDPLVKANPELFEPADQVAARPSDSVIVGTKVEEPEQAPKPRGRVKD